jgi:thioester reductase-like protein
VDEGDDGDAQGVEGGGHATAVSDAAFLTGFPGFLGSALVDRLLDRYDEVVCLVQPTYRAVAEERAADLAGPDWRADLTLREGDITDPTLGLDEVVRADLRERVAEVYHLAAVYDLGVERSLAERVNVDGTRHVLAFAAECRGLDRFQYVSTCYVSGRHDGRFTHRDLDVGQSFNNHYEATKFEAEVAVRERMAAGLPATIYRPAITVGDSVTGRTDKYDGPYYLLRWLTSQPRIAVAPMLGDPRAYELNVVPRDYVVDAIAALSARDGSENEVYQLCDPNPPTVGEVLSLFAAATGRRVVPVPATTAGLKRLLSVPAVRDVAGIEPAALDYFTHPTTYTDANARRALARTDVSPPPLSAYVENLVEYVRDHPDVRADAMV